MTITDEAPPGADTSRPRSRPRGSTGRPTGPKKFRWMRFGVAMLVIYVLSSLLLQSRSTANVTSIPYTSFTQQVDANNVATIHATGGSIDGTLRKPQPVPGGTKGQTYTTFSTFRPIFAQDTV
ncbi:MAG: cell division protease FtsH, partial [Pseudonocardiales bacterium]|nr:cell division protease FtsH [Pseudonocardiales bacterium]